MGGLRPTTEDHRLVPSPVVPVPTLLFVLSPLALGTLQWSLSKALFLSQGLGHSSELPHGYLYDSEDHPSQESLL